MDRTICIHGHFYQPPRENPWLDMVEQQDTAYPFHDWNERITAECYGPNAVARILGPDGRIVRLVNNYARISFDAGPTLLAWMQSKAPDVYAAILQADHDARARFGGHGTAIALPFAHPILPLCTPADKATQVVWGIRDFEQRFGREPEGMWLPECAVDIASLEALAAHGIRFTILGPTQASRARPRDGVWEDVTGGRIDPSRAYVQKLPSGRSIVVFFYHAGISHAVAFEGLLRSGEALADRLLGALGDRDEPQLIHIAADGEAFGHHHAHGDMALAFALGKIESSGAARLTNYGEFLDRFPPQWEVQIIENTSWSCAHGLERWRSDCGCNAHVHPHQRWREPLRKGLDELRDAVAPLYETHAGDILADPAAARNDYVRVMLDHTPETQERFLDRHARRQLDEPARVKALEMMELQRHALLMFASCGWFFDEISGLESTQVLMNAGRVVHLAEKLFAQPLEAALLQTLEQAPSNLDEVGTGRAVYERIVRPTRVERQNVGAHYAVSSLFESYPRSTTLFCFRVEKLDDRTFEAGRLKMVVGHALLTSQQTGETWDFVHAALHFGDHNITAGVMPYPGEEAYTAHADALSEAFGRADIPGLMRVMDRQYGESIYSLSSLFRDEQRKVLKQLLKPGLTETMDLYTRVYEKSQPLMRFLKHLTVPLPLPLRAAAEVLCNTDLRWALDDDDPDFAQVRDLLHQAREWNVQLDGPILGYRYTRLLARAADRWRDHPATVEPMQILQAGVDLAGELPFDVNLYQPQNVWFELADTVFPDMATDGGEAARAWAERFVELGEKLGIDTSEVKKKLVSPTRRERAADLVARLVETRRVPLATYRLQMNPTFPFAAAVEVVDYLEALGISDVYLSPILKARPDSMHGYDITDPREVNPQLGGEDGMIRLADELGRRGMGVLLDVVPNHMGIGHASNAWWMDVLENGASSRYAEFFDIDWSPVNPDLAGKVLLPNLGEQYGGALESGVFRLAYEKGSFALCYYENRLPLAPRTYHDILSSRLDYLCKRLGEAHDDVLEYRSILTALEHIPPREKLPPNRRADRYREVGITKKRLATLVEASPDVRAAVESAVELYNGNIADPSSFDRLDALIGAQPYRPAFWQVAKEEINYRRFFDVNDLAAIRTELPAVFDATHAVPLRLLVAGKAHGLRIDHPDGLHSPANYFRRLQEVFVLARLGIGGEGKVKPERLARQVRDALDAIARDGGPWPLYVLAEKILGEHEPLPADWAVDGTTGYDFLNSVNGLFVAAENGAAIDRAYTSFVGEMPRFDELVRTCKQQIMDGPMASEIYSLSHQLDRLAERNRRYRDFTLNNLELAIRDLIACLPVYRTYTTAAGEVSPRDRAFIEDATEAARRLNPRTADAVFDFLRDTLLLRNREQFPEADRPRLLEWVLRFQQVTGPVMAKGIEDTTFYIYNRLVSLNEVGGHPSHLGTTPDEFHDHNRRRLAAWPHAMLSTSTHDTKRSEDVRARINVLSEMPEEWQRLVNEMSQAHSGLITRVDGRPAPTPNDQYLFYQTLVGVWQEGGDTEALCRRLAEYMVKAAKEAKQSTSWINPNEEYDDALRRFVRGVVLLDDPSRGALAALARKAAYFGRFNSLVQVLFKLTAPGVPDIYQGCEMWDLSLVDPDNRRPVDYAARRAALDDVHRLVRLRGLKAAVGELLTSAEDGRIKLYITVQALALRSRLAKGYEGVRLAGEYADCACAFLRNEGRVLVIGCTRGLRVTRGQMEVPAGAAWSDTFFLLPGADEGGEWVNELTGERVGVVMRDGELGVWAREALALLPLAVLTRSEGASAKASRGA